MNKSTKSKIEKVTDVWHLCHHAPSQINFNIWNQENVLCVQFFQSFLRNGEDKIEGIVCL